MSDIEYEEWEEFVERELNIELAQELRIRLIKSLHISEQQPRIVKPTSFYHRKLEARQHQDRVLTILNRSNEDKVKSLNGELTVLLDILDVSFKEHLLEALKYQGITSIDQLTANVAPYDAVFKPLAKRAIPYDTLLHSTFFFDCDYREPPALDHFLETNGVFGNPDPNKPTYLKSERVLLENTLGCYNEERTVACPLHLVIDVNDLLKTRTIFYDPEGITRSAEFKETFLIFGGIPKSSIITAEFEYE